MSLVISDDLVRASGFSENELFLKIVLMLFWQGKIRINHSNLYLYKQFEADIFSTEIIHLGRRVQKPFS
jgi:predicted HTH domain antitoxin